MSAVVRDHQACTVPNGCSLAMRQLQTIPRDDFSSALLPSPIDGIPSSEEDARLPRRASTAYDPFTSRRFARISTQTSLQQAPMLVTSPFERRSSTLQTSSANISMFAPYETQPGSTLLFEPFGLHDSDQSSYEVGRHSGDYDLTQNHNALSSSYNRDYEVESSSSRANSAARPSQRYNPRRRPFNQDEFDGPNHLLPLPLPQAIERRSGELPHLSINLISQEQDEILSQMNIVLSQCAFHFVAKYQFPIPLERDKPRVMSPTDREWTEWAYLLKRLATKRRIPARVLYKNQIKHLVTTLENSLDIKYNARDQTRQLKDDRNVLQLISAATQVAKILSDALAMEQLDGLYARTESIILQRRARPRGLMLS